MENKKYEKPRFEFQEMRLMERVAEKCWGHGYAFIDDDLNPSTPPAQYYFVDNGGCEGNADIDLQDRLDQLFSRFPELIGANPPVALDDVKTNVKNSKWINGVTS